MQEFLRIKRDLKGRCEIYFTFICMAAPLCIFWTMWMERNRVVFENEVPSAHRMKSLFLFSLWSWAKVYNVDNFNSLVEFLTWMGYR